MAKHLDDAEMFLEYGIHIPSQTIQLTGEVNDEMYEKLARGLVLIKSRKNGSTDITIDLNSPGGDWSAGIAIHDLLASCDFPVTIRVLGMAMSMASIILQAADVRLIAPGATVMVHDGEGHLEGSTTNIAAWAEHARKDCEYMYKIYAAASKQPISFWKRKCKKDFIMTAEEAINLGLADGYIK